MVGLHKHCLRQVIFQVVLCANSKPALNDVTAQELLMVMKQVTLLCPVLREHLEAGTLCVRESGQASPCLDLRCVNALDWKIEYYSRMEVHFFLHCYTKHLLVS